MFNQYPYLNLNDLNLDYLLNEIKRMYNDVTNFVSINAIKYADPIQWNITSQYEKNTVVIDPLTGTAYISVAAVPSGVALTRTEYWTVVFDLGSFVTRAAQNFTDHWESDTTTTATFSTTTGGWLVWGDVLYKALTNIAVGDTYVVGSNIEHFTIENLYNAYLNTIAQILANVGDLSDLNTTVKTSVVAAINEVYGRLNNFKTIKDYGAIGDGITDDSTSFANCFNNESLIIIPPGNYKINCDLTGSHKTIIGYGAIIKTESNLYFHNFEDITIIGLEIDGMSTAPIPLYFKIGHHAKVVDCEILRGTIICLQFSTVDGVTVDGCTLHDTTDATNSNTVLAFNVPVGDPSGYEEIGSIVTNCEIYGGGLDGIIANMNYITISNCSLHNNGWRSTAAGIYVNGKYNHTYNGNLIYKNTGNGIDLDNCGNVTCNGNYISENLCAGILYAHAHGGLISDNICNNNGSQAIVPEQSGGVSIADGSDSVIVSHNTLTLNNYGVITSGVNSGTILDGNVIGSNTVTDIQASSNYKIADYTTVTV